MRVALGGVRAESGEDLSPEGSATTLIILDKSPAGGVHLGAYEVVAPLEREARAPATLNHPHIVQIYRVGAVGR